jgi:hypothetical protein
MSGETKYPVEDESGVHIIKLLNDTNKRIFRIFAKHLQARDEVEFFFAYL